MSTSSQIAQALCACLAKITQANGFATDIGVRVYRGKRALDDTDLPCVVLIEGDDTAEATGVSKNTKVITTGDYYAEAHLPCDPDNPNDAAHEAIADIKRAWFAPSDPYFDGLLHKGLAYQGRTIEPREAGVAAVAVSVHVQAVYVETLDRP